MNQKKFSCESFSMEIRIADYKAKRIHIGSENQFVRSRSAM
jgi:hypothetical protein